MLNVYVCVGSSCHLKGSYDIITLMREKIKKLDLDEKVNLAAAFCLGKCTEGVSIKVDDEVICGVSKDNFDEIWDNNIQTRLNA